MYMQGLANFIDDFLGGLMLISYALVVGSVLWSFVILRVTAAGRFASTVGRRRMPGDQRRKPLDRRRQHV